MPARAVSGTLRVALADSVCSTFLPDLLQQFHALCPQVELVLRTATADEMLRLLGANQNGQNLKNDLLSNISHLVI